MRASASEIADLVVGSRSGDDVTIDGASIDSRTIEPGQLFVPIVAERDGHEFISTALDRGAGAYLTSRDPVGGSAIQVRDTLEALQTLARRLGAQHFDGKDVIGVTGSVGKTSVKDLLAAILREGFSVSASAGNFNNEYGVPLTVLNAPDGTEKLVVEMGARSVGNIAELCSIAHPTIGVVTRVAAAHTEVFGSIDAIAQTKGELVEALPPDGTAILNAADELVAAMATRAACDVVRFGVGGDVTAEGVAFDDELRARFRLVSPWGSADVVLAVHGAHQVDNALASAAAALASGATLAHVVEGLARAAISEGRMTFEHTPAGAVVINDAYNANPTSMRAALEALAALPATRRAAVVGVMAELGPSAPADHAAIGELAHELGIRLIAVGTVDYGGDVVAGIEEALAALGQLGPGDAVLVKGSRVAGLERLAARLRGDPRQ